MITAAVLLTIAATAPEPQDVPLPEGPPSALLAAIERQRTLLDAERAEMAEARADLKAAEAQLDSKITALEKLIAERRAVEESIVAARTVLLDDRTKRLMEITQKMKPVRAARYLQGLDDQVAISILEGMSVRKAALIISALPDSKTSKLSRLYLAREPRSEPRTVSNGDTPAEGE